MIWGCLLYAKHLQLFRLLKTLKPENSQAEIQTQ